MPRDDAEAVKWFRKAAEQGFVGAQGSLGFIYDNVWSAGFFRSHGAHMIDDLAAQLRILDLREGAVQFDPLR